MAPGKVRFLMIIVATLCPIVCYMSRLNLSLAIVAMVHDTDHDPNEPTSVEEDANITISKVNAGDSYLNLLSFCPAKLDENDTQPLKPPSYGPKYDWSSDDQGLINGAFFYSYVIFQIPFGRVSEIAGAKWVMAAAGIGSAVLSLIAPLAAATHLYLFVLTRFMMGAFQTAMFPSGYILYAAWLPPAERSLALTIYVMGAFIGQIIASPITGYFCESPTHGWTWSFYLPGILCAIWSLIWVVFASSTPREHRFISTAEIEYIESKIGLQTQDVGEAAKKPSWRKMLTSAPVWAMVAAFFSTTWAFSFLMITLPKYLNDVMHIPKFKNGLIQSILFTIYCIASPIIGSIATWMTTRRPCGITSLQTRKLFEGIALFGCCICFALLPWMDCNQALMTLIVVIIVYSSINGGDVPLPTEITASFSGTLYAFGNTIGSSTGFLVPQVQGLIVTKPDDRQQWNTFFYVSAVIIAIGGVIFTLIGSNAPQDFTLYDKETPMVMEDITLPNDGIPGKNEAKTKKVSEFVITA